MAASKVSKLKKEPAETGLAKHDPIQDALAKVERLTREAEAMAAGTEEGESESNSQALVPVVDRTLAAPALKAKMAKTRALTLKKQNEMKRASEALEALMKDKVYAMEAAMRPLQKMVEQMTEIIWTINLFTGRDEQIEMLRDGKPAAASTPLHVRQQVLSADEESAIGAEEGGIDAKDIKQFDEWILSSPAHLQQVLPEEKGIVVFVPRRQQKDYGDPWMQNAMDAANVQSYWLIRNGEKLFRMATNFEVGKTLVPTRDEFISFFVEKKMNWETHEYESVQLQPGSYSWIQAEEHSDKRKRHFMRVALILQGLIERTPILHPLPQGGLNLLTIDDYEAGKVKVILDAEMLLGEGKELFKDWLKRLNHELRIGMRIAGNFDGQAFRYVNENERGIRHSRLRPNGAAHPQSDVLYQIEDRVVGGGLLFHYERKEEIWDERTRRARKPKMRASCLVFPDDTFILPFDLVTVQEMEYYLTSRQDRPNYIEMIPLLKSAIAAKKAEEESEEPFRRLIVGQLMAQAKMDYEEAVTVTPGLVDWWKLSNRWHRALVNEPEAEAKALRMIVAEGKRRKQAEKLGSESDWLAQGRLTSIEGMLAIFQMRDGTYLGVAEQTSPYLRHYKLARNGRGTVEPVGEWQLPSPGLQRWRLVWSAPKWKTWPMNVSASDHLSGPEKQVAVGQILEQVKQSQREKRSVMAITYKSKERLFEAWLAAEEKVLEPKYLLSKRLPDVHLSYLEGKWKRSKAGVSVEVYAEWAHTYYWHEDQWKREGRELLWEDEGMIHQARKWKKTVETASKRRNVLFEKMHKLEVTIEAAWSKAEEEKAYARFIEDYQDAELWEGHKKTLKVTRMPNDQALRRLTEILVEMAVDPIGLSVAEARERALKLPKREMVGGLAAEDEYEFGETIAVGVPELEQLSEIANLRYGAVKPSKSSG